MENTNKLDSKMEAFLAKKDCEIEAFIDSFDDKTKHVLQWYHGCTTNFLKQVCDLIDQHESDPNYLNELASFLGLEVERHNVVVPFWEETDLSEDEDDEEGNDDDANEDINSDDEEDNGGEFKGESDFEVEKANIRSEIYRHLLDQRIDIESEVIANLKSMSSLAKILRSELQNILDNGNKEPRE